MDHISSHKCVENGIHLDGWHVCSKCGLCLDNTISGIDIPHYDHSKTFEEAVENPVDIAKHQDFFLDELTKCCEITHLPTKFADEAYTVFLNLMKSQPEGIKHEMQKRDLAFASLYHVLRKNKVYFSLGELKKHFWFTQKALVYYHKWLDNTEISLHPSDVTFRFCGRLSLPRKDAMEIYQRTKTWETTTNHANKADTVAAALICSYYHKKYPIATTLQSGFKIKSLSELCDIIGVSKYTIRRFLNKYKDLLA